MAVSTPCCLVYGDQGHYTDYVSECLRAGQSHVALKERAAGNERPPLTAAIQTWSLKFHLQFHFTWKDKHCLKEKTVILIKL